MTILIFTALFLVVLERSRTQNAELSAAQSLAQEKVEAISIVGRNVAEVHLAITSHLGKAYDLDKGELYDLTKPTLKSAFKVKHDLERSRALLASGSEADAALSSLSDAFEELRRQYVSSVVRVSFDTDRFDQEMRATNASYLATLTLLGRLTQIALKDHAAASEAISAYDKQIIRSLAIGLALCAALSLVASWLISARYAYDLGGAIQALTNLANGKTSNFDPEKKSRKDELGALTRSIAFFEGVLGLLMDEISVREKNEAQLRHLFESAGDAILVMEDGEYVAANKQAERMLGINAKRIRDYRLGAFADLSDHSLEQLTGMFLGHVNAALQGEPQTFEWSIAHSDGTTFPTECTVAAFVGPDGKKIVQLIIRDISSRKEAEQLRQDMTQELERMVCIRTKELQREIVARRDTEEALVTAQRTLEAVVDHAPIGMILLDTDHRVLLINNWIRAAHHLPDALCRPGSDYVEVLSFILSSTRTSQRSPEALKRILAERTVLLDRRESGVFEDVLPDGSFHKVERRFVDGVGCIITNTDITDLKNAQNDLVRQEKMAALGGLVAGVAHEVNTPLGICVTAASHVSAIIRDFRQQVMSPTGGLSRKLAIETLDKTGEGLAIVEQNLNRAAGLIKSFKMVSVDQAADDSREIELGDYIRDTLQSLTAETKRSKLKVELVRPKTKIMRHTYPGALVQIVTNLVINAGIHAYDGNGGDLRIEVERLANGSDRISVRDYGKGMDRAVRSQIFDPFFTTKRANGGTGLGLHIVFNLVTQRLGGQIECRSAPGEGSTFEITLN
ncbi:ATP-binding protein [Nisaea sediminum]|uniref:ATP-binding protein n=1 Tax=Nisaea sediminum TaxID=2775867 RepID=UPI00186738B4|nr:ATP-binding protein [Nisaea sediminum]